MSTFSCPEAMYDLETGYGQRLRVSVVPGSNLVVLASMQAYYEDDGAIEEVSTVEAVLEPEYVRNLAAALFRASGRVSGGGE